MAYKNKEDQVAYSKAYRGANKERRAAQQRDYNKANKETLNPII